MATHLFGLTDVGTGKQIELVDITSIGGGLADNAATNVKLADMATQTFKGRNSGGTGDPEDLSMATARTMLNVANGATANLSDATLLDRSNHTGTQTTATLSDYTEATQDLVGALLVAGTNVTLTYNDGAGTLTIDAAAGVPGADSVTNTILANMAEATLKGRAVGAGTGDPTDLTATQARTVLNVADGATANSSDATLLARANHTGTQLSSTISDFAEAVQDVAGAAIVAGTNILVTYNDGAGTITIDNTAAGVGTDSVSNTHLVNMAQATIKGRQAGGGTGDPEDLTAAQARTVLNVADGATANSSDATLLARANHTGTQLASTVSDFSEAVDDRVGALLVAGTNVTLNYNDGAGTLTITAATGAPSADSVTNIHLANMATATIKGRATAGTGDPEDLTAAQTRTLLNVADGATANSSDATLLARANHTGTQTAATISDFNEAVDDRVDALLVEGTGITLTYNDGAGTLTIDAATAASGNFTPGGTGSVTRTMDVKVRELGVSVLDYGADATGVADSSTAFQNAMNAADGYGLRTLYIPAGTYRLNSTWTIDQHIMVKGAGRTQTVINSFVTGTHAMELLGSSGLIQLEDFEFHGSATQTTGFHGIRLARKTNMKNVSVDSFTNDGIWYDTFTGGPTGAVFFSVLDNVWSKNNGRDGIAVRSGANANLFVQCQFDSNGQVGFHHYTDGTPTYGNVVILGQCSYNGSYGYWLESGTDFQAYGLYGERNGCSTPGDEATDYTTTPFDFYFEDNTSRSWANVGTLFGSSTTHIRAPARNLNDGCMVMQGGRRIWGSTAYMMTSEAGAIPTVSTANATDLPTAIALVNALKTSHNNLLAQLRLGNAIAP